MKPNAALRIYQRVEPKRRADRSKVEEIQKVIDDLNICYPVYKILAKYPKAVDICEQIKQLQLALEKVLKAVKLSASMCTLLEKPQFRVLEPSVIPDELSSNIPEPLSTKVTAPSDTHLATTGDDTQVESAFTQISNWKKQTEMLLSIVKNSISILPKNDPEFVDALMTRLIIYNDISTNWFTNCLGPEEALIMKIYRECQFLYKKATWSKEFDSLSVRFAVQMLEELQIKNPKTDKYFTDRQVVAVWNNFGKSHSQST